MSFRDFPQYQDTLAILTRTLRAGRLAHGYLFIGNLADMEALAKTLVKTLNCEQPVPAGQTCHQDCCDRCSSCKRIDNGNYPDLTILRPESKSRVITIEQMRDLIHVAQMKPLEAKVKAGLIVAADRLNKEAANTFLKTLEEPPPGSIFILLTTDPQQMLETILSRCLRLPFGGGVVSDAEQPEWIGNFATMASGGSHGNILERYRLLSSLLAYLAEAKAAVEERLAKESPLEKNPEASSKLKEKWEDELSAAIEAEYRRLRAESVTDLQWLFRDAALQSGDDNRSMVYFPKIGPLTEAMGKRIGIKNCMAAIEQLERLNRQLEGNVQEALAFEVAFLKLNV